VCSFIVRTAASLCVIRLLQATRNVWTISCFCISTISVPRAGTKKWLRSSGRTIFVRNPSSETRKFQHASFYLSTRTEAAHEPVVFYAKDIHDETHVRLLKKFKKSHYTMFYYFRRACVPIKINADTSVIRVRQYRMFVNSPLPSSTYPLHPSVTVTDRRP